jgi:hypothetical protein
MDDETHAAAALTACRAAGLEDPSEPLRVCRRASSACTGAFRDTPTAAPSHLSLASRSPCSGSRGAIRRFRTTSLPHWMGENHRHCHRRCPSAWKRWLSMGARSWKVGVARLGCRQGMSGA